MPSDHHRFGDRELSDHSHNARLNPTDLANLEAKLEAEKRRLDEARRDARDARRLKVEGVGALFATILVMLTAFTGWQTRQAVRSTLDANALTRESLRARILVDEVTLARPIRPNENPIVAYRIKNIGRSEASYGVIDSMASWAIMPDGEMPLPDPPMRASLESEAQSGRQIIDGLTITQQFLDGLPVAPYNPGELTEYYFGKVVYESLGEMHRVEFCVYLTRTDNAVDPKLNPNDSDYHLFLCPKWNDQSGASPIN